VAVGHVEDLLPRVVPYLLGVVGGDVRLDVLDQLVIRLAFDIHTARTVNDLHGSPCLDSRAMDLRSSYPADAANEA